jgi:hypothetical protein
MQMFNPYAKHQQIQKCCFNISFFFFLQVRGRMSPRQQQKKSKSNIDKKEFFDKKNPQVQTERQ